MSCKETPIKRRKMSAKDREEMTSNVKSESMLHNQSMIPSENDTQSVITNYTVVANTSIQEKRTRANVIPAILGTLVARIKDKGGHKTPFLEEFSTVAPSTVNFFNCEYENRILRPQKP